MVYSTLCKHNSLLFGKHLKKHVHVLMRDEKEGRKKQACTCFNERREGRKKEASMYMF